MPERDVTTIRMPGTLSDKLKKIADSKGVSKNTVMLEAIWQYVKSSM